MIFRRLRTCSLWKLQNVAVLLALAGVVVSSVGIVFVPTQPQTSQGAYPCQGGTCGCTTADQCWRSCCCTTVDERLAWAKQNGVTPPSFVQLAAKTTPAKPQVRACCLASHDPIEPGTGEMPNDVSPANVIVLMESVNRCRGLAAYVAIYGAAICEPIKPAAQVEQLLCACLPCGDILLKSHSQSPPTPPPRAMV